MRLPQHAKIVDVKRRSVRIEEFCLHVIGVAEGVGRPSRDGHVVASFCVDGVAVEGVEADGALSHQESFVVLLGGGVSRAGGFRGKRKSWRGGGEGGKGTEPFHANEVEVCGL